ncbi:hypothetical protein ACROYT_G007585 [Oculina patagonica]
MPFQESRANQVICTGISQIILGCCVFTLSFILSKRRDDLGDIFEIGVEYWTAIPIVIAGVLGITGGFTGKFTVTGLFFASSFISCVLGGIVAAYVGIALTAWRSVGECEHVHCPYDLESILMIALISILILEAAISLSGVIESSQLLCCAVSGGDHVSIVSLGNSSRMERKPMLRSERINRKCQSKNNDLYSTDYDTSKTREYGFGNSRQSYRISEIGTIV